MNFRLFMLMGLTWTMDNLSAYIEKLDGAPHWTQILFYITDTINYLQGIFIFILLICKRKILLALMERLNLSKFLPTTVSNK